MSKKTVLIISAACLVIIAVSLGAYYTQLNKKPDETTQLVMIDKYMNAYKKPDLKTVLSLVDAEMALGLPTTQKEFAEKVKASSTSIGPVQKWQVTSTDTNPYVGQTMAEVTVMTTKKTYQVTFDIFKGNGKGREWKIRAVVDKNSEAAKGGSGGMGGEGYHGGQ